MAVNAAKNIFRRVAFRPRRVRRNYPIRAAETAPGGSSWGRFRGKWVGGHRGL